MIDDLPAAALERLAERLWEQRHRTEALLYRLVAAHLLASAGEHRFLAVALDEVERAAGAAGTAAGARAEALAVVAGWPGPPDRRATLDDLLHRAPPALAPVLTDHRDALHALRAEVDRTLATTRDLVADALDRTDRDRAARTSDLEALVLAFAVDTLEHRVPSLWSSAPLHALV